MHAIPISMQSMKPHGRDISIRWARGTKNEGWGCRVAPVNTAGDHRKGLACALRKVDDRLRRLHGMAAHACMLAGLQAMYMPADKPPEYAICHHGMLRKEVGNNWRQQSPWLFRAVLHIIWVLSGAMNTQARRRGEALHLVRVHAHEHGAVLPGVDRGPQLVCAERLRRTRRLSRLLPALVVGLLTLRCRRILMLQPLACPPAAWWVRLSRALMPSCRSSEHRQASFCRRQWTAVLTRASSPHALRSLKGLLHEGQQLSINASRILGMAR